MDFSDVAGFPDDEFRPNQVVVVSLQSMFRFTFGFKTHCKSPLPAESQLIFLTHRREVILLTWIDVVIYLCGIYIYVYYLALLTET